MAFVGFSYFVLRTYPHSEIAVPLLNRGEGYAAVVGLLPAGDLLAELCRRVRPDSIGRLAAAVAALVVVFVVPGKQASWRATALQQGPVSADAQAIAAALRSAPVVRFATERDFPAEIGRVGV